MLTTIPIIILNYNSANHTIKNIQSILKYNTCNEIKYKFIIIDNNSRIEEKNKLREYIRESNSISFEFNDRYDLDKLDNFDELEKKELIYIEMKDNHGYSYSNNIGLRLSDKLKYEYAIVANPDTRVINPETVPNMLNLISENDDIGVVFPQVVDPNGTHQEIMYETNFYSLVLYPTLYPMLFVPTKIHRKLKLKINSNDEYTKVYTSIGCFLMVSIKDMKKVDFLDEDIFLYGEEDILALKMKSINKKLVCSNKAIILHDHVIVNKETAKTEELKQYALKYVLKKYLNYSDSQLKMVDRSQRIYKKYYASTIDKLKNR